MGDFGGDCQKTRKTDFTPDPPASESEEIQEAKAEVWHHGEGQESWQVQTKTVRDRTTHLFNSHEMSDLNILACDENWWFGQTVKDYVGHRFLLASASPVFHRLLYEPAEDEHGDDRKLVLEPDLKVTLTLTPTYSGHRLEMEGIPPIAAEALLEYIYKDNFKASDFENGYSRNLLWRLWHASKAFEIDHLNELCTKTIDDTMCEETVFWDLNYSIQYKSLGVGETMNKVLKLMESLNERLYEHPNFVWLDQMAVKEILERRRPNNCEPITILNNLLRWSLYQIDRSACCEIDDKTNGDIPIECRIDWIRECRRGDFNHLSQKDLEKYLSRGTQQMPWTEMSQADFLKYVVPNGFMPNEKLLECSIQIMKSVVENPDRLVRSAFSCEQVANKVADKIPEKNPEQTLADNPTTPGRMIGRVGSLLNRGKRNGEISISAKDKMVGKIITNGTFSEEIAKPTSPA